MRNVPGLDSMKALVFYISVLASQGAVFSTLTSCDNEYGGQIDLCEGELKKILEKEPRKALEDFDKYKYKDKACAEEILKKVAEVVAEKDPGAALAYSDKYQGKPYAEDLLKKAAENAAESDPGSALAYFEKYQDKPYAEKILKKAVEKAAEDDPEAALRYFHMYQDKPYAEAVLRKAVEKAAESDPEAAVYYFDKYKNKPYAEAVLRKAVERSPRLALAYFDKYQDKPYAEEILKKAAENAAENNPEAALHYFDRYKNKPYASNIINTISLTELLLFLTQAGSLPEHKLFESTITLFEGLHSIKELKLSKKMLSLNLIQHLNIYSGLLKTYLSEPTQYTNPDKTIDRDKIRTKYESNIVKFIEQGKEWSERVKESINVFVVRAANSSGDDYNSSLTYNNENLKKIYEEKIAGVGKFHDYSSDVNPQSPEFILDAFEKSIESDPKGYHLFHLGAHGGTDGSALLKGGNRTKEHFDRLFNIQAKYLNNVKVDLSSCNSGTKDNDFYDNAIKNLSMDSGKQSSKGLEKGSDDIFLKAFKAKDKKGILEADYDGDGIVNFNEALLYRNINYNKSLTPTMFDDGSGGRAKDISLNDGIYRDASLYSS